jgi:hypothetical protein
MQKNIFLLAALLCSSCSVKINGLCFEGPDKGKSITAKASFNGFGSGKITAVAPWGEKALGRYNTNPYQGSTAAWNAESRAAGGVTTAHGDDLIIESDGINQVGSATLLGEQGTTFDVVYWGNAWTPTHGQGRARDSRGNRYKLVF